MDLDDVRQGGAFRRIHDFGAPPSSSSPSGKSNWIPAIGDEILLSYSPKGISFLQNIHEPLKSHTGIAAISYKQEIDDSFSSFYSGIGRAPSPVFHKSYIEFELQFEDTFGGVVMSIRADAVENVHIDGAVNLLQGRFIITETSIVMKVV
jgi:hypothetical protein